jgi:hypothetical protein
MEDPALDRFEAVVDVRDGAVEDDVAGVVEEPAPVGGRERRGVVLDLLALLAYWRRSLCSRGR